MAPYGANSYFDRAQGVDQFSESFYDNEDGISDPPWDDWDGGESLSSEAPGPIESQYNWMRGGIYLVCIVIAASFLTLSLKAYFLHQEIQSSPKPESEPRAYGGGGRTTGPAKASSASGGRSSAVFKKPLDSRSLIVARGIHEHVSAAVPIVSETAMSQSLQGVDIDGDFLSLLQRNVQPSKLDVPAAAYSDFALNTRQRLQG